MPSSWHEAQCHKAGSQDIESVNCAASTGYSQSESYMGVFVSPVVKDKRRRVDIKIYPFRLRVFASLYFTGNGWFNRSKVIRCLYM